MELKKLLIIDDEEVVLRTAARMLASLGFTAVTVKDGAEGIDVFLRARDEGEPFDVVITDLTIPGGIGGREVVTQLLQIDPGTKVIIASGYSNDPVMGRFEEYGFKGVIRKPFRMSELSDVMLGGHG